MNLQFDNHFPKNTPHNPPPPPPYRKYRPNSHQIFLKTNIDHDGFITVENKRRKVVPITISPGAGPTADSRILPPISYAKIHINQNKQKPTENFPEEILRHH